MRLLFTMILLLAACTPTAGALSDGPSEINEPATPAISGYQTAVRVNPPPQPDPAPQAAPLYEEESPPADLCASAHAMRAEVGLPVRFDALSWRESNCRNDVRTFCCYGIYQLYWSVISKDHRMGLRIAACGVDSLSDIYGETMVKRRANTCVAKALYDVAGYSPWAR